MAEENENQNDNAELEALRAENEALRAKNAQLKESNVKLAKQSKRAPNQFGNADLPAIANIHKKRKEARKNAPTDPEKLKRRKEAEKIVKQEMKERGLS